MQAVGSTLELKKQFGTGYLLHILKKDNFNEAVVLGTIHAKIGGAQVTRLYFKTLSRLRKAL